MNKWKVCIRCSTYNHSLYVAETLDGFVCQQTDFPFVAVIVDDASTDGEQQVLMNYLSDHFEKCELSDEYDREDDEASIHFARHKENKNCYFAVVLLKYNHYSQRLSKQHVFNIWQKDSEYVAICEGDDYWTDPDKISMQSSYLGLHHEYGMVRTNVDRLYQSENYIERRFFDKLKIKDTYLDYIYNAWWAAPCTWMIRSEMYRRAIVEANKIMNNGGFGGDIAIILYVSKYSKIKYFDQVTAIYRVLINSLSHFVYKKDRKEFYRRVRITRRWYAKGESLYVRSLLEGHILYRVILNRMMGPKVRSWIKTWILRDN